MQSGACFAFILAAAVCAVTHAYTYDPDYLIQDLYDRLSQLEDEYQTEPIEDETEIPETMTDPRSVWPEDSDITVNSRDYGQTNLRDQEHLDQPSKWGFQYISGNKNDYYF